MEAAFTHKVGLEGIDVDGVPVLAEPGEELAGVQGVRQGLRDAAHDPLRRRVLRLVGDLLYDELWVRRDAFGACLPLFFAHWCWLSCLALPCLFFLSFLLMFLMFCDFYLLMS